MKKERKMARKKEGKTGGKKERKTGGKKERKKDGKKEESSLTLTPFLTRSTRRHSALSTPSAQMPTRTRSKKTPSTSRESTSICGSSFYAVLAVVAYANETGRAHRAYDYTRHAQPLLTLHRHTL
jgi:hypothetical protein